MTNSDSGAAEAALRCLGVGAADDVLVLCNEEQRVVAASIAAAAEGSARSVGVLVYPALSRDGEEPPAHVAEAMREASVIFAATARSLSHTQARLDATRTGARIATLPGINQALFERTLPVDYDELRRAGEGIAAELSAASRCRVTSPAGTDVLLELEGRAAVVDDGDLAAEGAFGNLPAGEAFIAPVEGVAEGIVVFDGSLAGVGVLHEPVRVRLMDGRAVEADGQVGKWLLDTLDAGGSGGRQLAELGIGTNPAATLSGSILEDEKVIGTAHLAFGSNISFGGVNAASVHVDGVLLEPMIQLDERPPTRAGEPSNSNPGL